MRAELKEIALPESNGKFEANKILLGWVRFSSLNPLRY